MTSGLILRRRPRHACAPPLSDPHVPGGRSGYDAVHRQGDVWRCACGQLWRLGAACAVCAAGLRHRGGHHEMGYRWRPTRLTWSERWQLRRERKAAQR